MLKLTIIVLVCCLALAVSGQNNGVPKAQIDARIQQSAEWAAARMGTYIKLAGDYYLQNYVNLRSNVGKESLYAMSLDVLVADKNTNTQAYKTCNVEVIDDPIENKRILKSAQCQDRNAF